MFMFLHVLCCTIINFAITSQNGSPLYTMNRSTYPLSPPSNEPDRRIIPHRIPIPHKTHVVSRPSWSCTECSRRKIRCDKRIPCQPCIKRGKQEGCKRGEDIGWQYEQPTTIREEEGTKEDGKGLMEMMAEVLERMKRIERRMDEEGPPMKRQRNELVEWPSPQNQSNSPLPAINDREAENQETSVTIEYLALGKNRKLGILSGPKDKHTSTAPTTNLLSIRQTQKCPSIIRSMIINRDSLANVLQFHKTHVQWQHACIHSQTFDRQLNVFMDLLSDEINSDSFWYSIDPLWLALLFSIQTITFHQMPIELVQKIVPHRTRQSLVDGMLMASLRCLEVGNYMSKPNFFSCQTIAILSVCGHNVVDSNHLASLLAVGIKIAQMLNLHVLGAESDLIKQKGPSFAEEESKQKTEKTIALEMGKRVWWSLVQQDYFAIPFRGVSLVHPNQHDTPFPNNVMDEEIDKGSYNVYDDGTLTLILKQRITSMTSDILCRFFLNLGVKDVRLEEHVQPFEEALRKLLPTQWNFAPSSSFSLSSGRGKGYGPSLINYLNISVRHKILVIHRAFCGRKPKRQSDLRSSQEVCVHLARSILTFCTPLNDDLGSTINSLPGQLDVMWTTAYHAVAAATVLALDMFGQMNVVVSNQRREEVQEAYKILCKLSDRSPIAQRGVTLLSSLLQQYDSVRGIERVETVSNLNRSMSISTNSPKRNTNLTNTGNTIVSHSDFSPQNSLEGSLNNDTWDMNDWEQYKEIVTMLENNPDVGRLFNGTLGDPFA